jgi:DNA-directed RNA polymerase subunit RPC12/RpoP
MGILRRLFGGRGERPYVDKTGLYFYVQCEHCGSKVKLRADKQHDLNQREGGFVWHKTVVDPRCFKHIPVVVTMDQNYQVINLEIEGGRFISEDEYEPPKAAGTSS